MHLHRHHRIALSLALLGLAASMGLSSSPAEAQSSPAGGVLPPSPNVLLLIDRSGSMSRTVGGNVPNCTPGTDSNTLALPDGAGTINMDRWGQILQGLTGHVKPFYSCDTIDRTSARFKDEFSINNKPPPDADYIIPYNRPLSDGNAPTNTTTCAVTPGFLPGAVLGGGVIQGISVAPLAFANGWDGNTNDPIYAVPASKGSIVDRHWKNVSGITGAGYAASQPSTCTFSQYSDGQLDIARNFIRFSLMTSDSDPSNTVGDYGVSTGNIPWGDVTGGTGTKVDAAKPFDGQWSYLPQSTNIKYGPGPLPKAKLPSCATDTPDAVGVRHNSAPPWEGRHVPFPPVDGPDGANLEQIQRVLLATRPYGGSPLGGMMLDAADYLWRTDDYGPWAAAKSSTDDFVKAGCRKQYVVLVSDGASNQDLRPQCTGGGASNPNCAFPSPLETARTLYERISYGGYAGPIPGANGRVQTFVIGFGAKGSATPPVPEPGWWPYASCSAAVTGEGSSLQLNNNRCTPNRAAPPASVYPAGTMAEACCSLNDIAIAGDGGLAGNATPQGAFFVESEAEFSLAMGAILGKISASTTSRATPTFSSTYTSRDPTYLGGNANASFSTTLTPQPGGLWTADLSRKRNVCTGLGAPLNVGPVNANDDKFLNATLATTKRFTIVPVPVPNTGVYDPTVTFRPYDTTDADLLSSGGTAYSVGKEVLVPNTSAGSVTPGTLKADLFGVTGTSCGSINIGTVSPPITLPALTSPDACANAIFGFAATYTGAIAAIPANGKDYNLRCQGGGGAGIYNRFCNPIGGILHSQPVVAPPPQAFLADEGYRAFAKTYAGRPAVLYVETMDGLLHGYDATNDSAGGPFGNELFTLIPPAVIPTLSANFPTGAATLLDNSPVVKDVVWERARGEIGAGAANRWHTMLVAGQPGGYFAMEVSDPVVDVIAAGKEPGAGATYGPYKPSLDTGSLGASAYQPGPQVAGNTPQLDFEVGNTSAIGPRPVGPHFMWQLTTANEALPERLTSTSKSRASNLKQYPLFAETVAKPAITTLFFQDNAAAQPREVGVAILPGGMPTSALTPGECRTKGGVTATTHTDFGGAKTYPPRTKVRNWGDGCTPGAIGAGAVPGRSVSLVRLDTGEIIRVFARKSGAIAQDLPNIIPTAGAANKVVNVPLDSPMTGTPVVYPNDVGAVAQRFYMGDADGMVWRFDVSDTNPDNWTGRVFYDTQNSDVNPNASMRSLDGQPIMLEPVVSQDQKGRAVIIIATGDQDVLNQPKKTDVTNLVPPANYIVSITDTPDAGSVASGYSIGYVNWVYDFGGNAGERVTGPISVFNNGVYFASYFPPAETLGTACNSGAARIFGFDFTVTTGTNSPTFLGGFPVVAKDNGGATVNYVPGVVVQAGLQCATVGGGMSSFGAYSSLSFSSTAAPTFTLSAISNTGTAIGGIGGANIPPIQTPTTATIDSWAAVVE